MDCIKSHCQIVTEVQSNAASALRADWSLATFLSIFADQNLALDAGLLPRGQSWPCQKQPCTNTAILCRGNTMSGLPGRSLRWSRKRRPLAWSKRLTAISGAVSLLRTCAIIRERTSLETRSTIRNRLRLHADDVQRRNALLPSIA